MTESESRRLKVTDLQRFVAEGDTRKALEEIRNATIDPYIMPPGREERLAFERGAFQGPVHGAFGFYLLIHAADFWNNGSRPSSDLDFCNDVLKHEEVRDHIFISYDVPPKHYCEGLSLYRVGATSYLFTCLGSSAGLVLKVLKPRYLDNPGINRETERLASKVRHNNDRWCRFAPFIVCATKVFVLMELIEGQTLREAVADNCSHRRPHQYIEWLRPIAHSLSLNVKWLAEAREPHLDLSPDNIILDRKANYEPVFVDFGQNYLLVDTFGSAARAHRYAAPELLSPATRANNDLADLYSLGAVLLEICQTSSVRRDESIGNQIEHIRENYAPLALTLETLTDRNADSRLFEERHDPLWLENLDQRLQAELERYQHHLRPSDRIKKVVVVSRWILASADRVYETSDELGDAEGPDDETVALRRCATVCQMVHFGLLVACVNGFFGIRVDSLPLDTAWPGLLVALSFTFIATMYYLNIYADLRASSLDTKTERVMRAMSGFHLLPIGVVMSIYPPAWPFCAAIGVFAVALNNRMTFALAKTADKLAEHPEGAVTATPGVHVPGSRAGFIQEYKMWSLLMFIYGVLLVVTGIGLWTGLMVDEKAYAIFVAVLNVVILCKNCIDHAPMVRAGLMWSFTALRRTNRYEESHRRPAAAAPIEQVMPAST